MQAELKKINLNTVTIDGEQFFKISNVDGLRPFFMSIVSDSDHWLFISSNGGISAGRKNAEYALFPYYTDDKITESTEITGSKTILQVFQRGEMIVWEPFSIRNEGKFKLNRNLYKSVFSNKIIFEEINTDLKLVFQYQWNFSNAFGFVKKSKLLNLSGELVKINILDGIQNIVPYGVGSELQNNVSNLADAYKRSELEPESGLGIFALSAIIVDKAEPSEALRATVVYSLGLENPEYLLSSLQLNDFRNGKAIIQEADIKGEKGAYFVCEEAGLLPKAEKEWMLVANVNQNHAAVIRLIASIKNDKHLGERIRKDIALGTENLVKLTAAADGLQFSADERWDCRHYSNVLFNIMRGGIFDENYQIERRDFCQYLEKANQVVFAGNKHILDSLPETFSQISLKESLKNVDDLDFLRLATEYLPLKFSRRHGDPSRPWNKFSINTQSEADGSKVLAYEGNWRDIFQNWEALAHAYPAFIEGMIFKFLNASTFEGYNPYRVTKDGFDWEIIEHDNPWSYIGYWGDHQVIYLLKLFEFASECYPELLVNLLASDRFVYANIPYKIKPYRDILRNPKDTIDFDVKLDKKIQEKRNEIGADGALLPDKNGKILHVNLTEKILAVVLSKLSNFILEGGIWMNTQRPEWNDANNALVGNGASMVTLYYLRRFLQFFKKLLEQTGVEDAKVCSEVFEFYQQIQEVLQKNQALLNGAVNDRDRKKILDRFGQAASDFRWQIYEYSFSGDKRCITRGELLTFANLAQAYIEHSINANQRKDKLYHGYNIISFDEDSVSVGHLSEMLEGQVGVLSAGCLTAESSLEVLDALQASSMFRKDQQSYMLYPNKNLPGFLQKNTIPGDQLAEYGLLEIFSGNNHASILEKDALGNYHFNGYFRNANDLKAALDANSELGTMHKDGLLSLFEAVFQHKAFTGRSGTFYGYEGLGSIYWHMVSKLRLAVLETVVRAIEEKADRALTGRLIDHYYAITDGLGVHKPVELYGAFPTDPYSHTPFGKGAQQPGMTGQVKEDILCRLGELGVFVWQGLLHFQPTILRKSEFLTSSKTIVFYDVEGKRQEYTLEGNALFFTCCQVPVVYTLAAEEELTVFDENGAVYRSKTLGLNKEITQEILNRSGKIHRVKVCIHPERLL